MDPDTRARIAAAENALALPAVADDALFFTLTAKEGQATIVPGKVKPAFPGVYWLRVHLDGLPLEITDSTPEAYAEQLERRLAAPSRANGRATQG
jgi:hypothetical protein